MVDEPSGSTNRDQQVNDIIAAYLEAVDTGQAPDRLEWLRQYPEYAAELEAFFADYAQVDRMAEPLRAAVGVKSGSPLQPVAVSGGGVPTGDSAQAASLPVGTKVRYFGDYELLDEIARGGMGIVYKARQMSLNRRVALKMILAGQLASAADVERFHREAESAANLQHPNIVAIHEVGLHAGQHYFSMEYVEGQNLAVMARENPLPVLRAAHYLKTIAEAVHYAHSEGILHRDLKPANVLIDRFGKPRITDFGLAKKITSDSELTASNQVLGTPSYMPPEQVLGRQAEVGPASDVYSLGAILYELLTGRPPFRGETNADTFTQVLQNEPITPRLLNPTTPRDMETIVLKCLEKEPAQRYVSAEALADDLGHFLRSEPIHARPIGRGKRLWRWCGRKPALAITGAVAILAVLTTLLTLTIAFLSASQARDNAIRNSAKLALERGYEQCIRGDPRQGVLSLAQALQEASRTRSPELEYSIRMQLAGWTRHLDQLEWILSNPRRGVLAAAFAPDGKTVLTSTGSLFISLQDNADPHIAPGELQIWDPASSKLQRATGQKNLMVLIAVLPEGKTALTLEGQPYQDSTMQLVNLETGQLVGTRIQVTNPIFGPKQFASLGAEITAVLVVNGKEVRLHEVGSWKALGPAMDLGNVVRVAALSPDGKTAFASGGRRARLWDAHTGNLLKTLEESEISMAAFSPDGQTLATVISRSAYMCDVQFRNISDAELLPMQMKPLKHSYPITAIAFSPDGQILATGSSDIVNACMFHSEVNLWFVGKWGDYELAGPPMPQKGYITSITFRNDGKTLLTTSIDMSLRPTGELRLWQVNSIQDGACQVVLRNQDDEKPLYGRAAHLSPDTKTVLLQAPTSPFEVRLFETQTGKPQGEPMKGPGYVRATVFTTDGRMVLTLGEQPTRGTVSFWDATTGRKLREDLQLPGACRPLAISPDGKILLTCKAMDPATEANPKTVQLWDAGTGKTTAPPLSLSYRVLTAAFSPDGKTIATAGGDSKTMEGKAQLWNAGTTNPAGPALQLQGPVEAVTFSPDGKILLTGSYDGTVQMWDTTTGVSRGVLFRHRKWVKRVAISPDGKLVLTGAYGFVGEEGHGEVRLCEIRSGREIGVPWKHHSMFPDVSFSLDGSEAVHVVDVPTNAVFRWSVAPFAGSSERIAVWSEVITGMELGPNGDVRMLDGDSWLQRRHRLDELGGLE